MRATSKLARRANKTRMNEEARDTFPNGGPKPEPVNSFQLSHLNRSIRGQNEIGGAGLESC
jgi:hypothetical protein